MFRSVLDSGWIDLEPLTVLVGKNEAGKTTLLKALHKLNPFKPEPYLIDREWPRGHRSSKDTKQVVCTARFKLNSDERGELAKLTDQKMTAEMVDVTRNYAGEIEVVFPDGVFPATLHPNDIDRLCAALPQLADTIGEDFRVAALECREEARRLAVEILSRVVDRPVIKRRSSGVVCC
jgi:ABC-type cobalamin/Fe3+-siderophores transport system ATPase subunit